MGVGQWAGWYNFKPGDIREKTGRSCMNKPSGYLGEEHSRQRGRQWKELGQEARLVCLKNSKDSRVAGVKRERGRQGRCRQPHKLCTAQLRRAPLTRTTVRYAESSLLKSSPGPGVGDEVREVLGSPVGQEKAFPLSETRSHCQEGSELEA